MEALGSVEKDSGASASTRTAEAPAVAARQTRANSAQLALEPIALSNRLETMLLGNHPVPAPSNEVSVASEVSNGIILVAKAAVDALFSSPQRAALMALGLRDLKPAALAYLVWDLRGVLAGARHDQAVAYGKRLQTHAAGVERELLKCKRRKADGAEEALLAVVPDALQDVPMPEATETDSEPDPEPTPSAEIETFYPTSLCDREWERYTSAIEQSADRALAQRDDELGASFREYVASSNPMHQQTADCLRKTAALALFDGELRYWWRMHRAEERSRSVLEEELRDVIGELKRCARSLDACTDELDDALREIDSLREALAASRRAWPHVGGGRA